MNLRVSSKGELTAKFNLMEKKMLKQCDKELMKAAILKQDQVFKQQVQELHRLYRTQKILMSSCIQTSSNQQPKHITSQLSILDLKLDNNENNDNNNENDNDNDADPAVDTTNNANGMSESLGQIKHIEEDEIELTLGPSTYMSTKNTRITKKTILTPHQTVSAGKNTSCGQRESPISSSSSTGSSQTKRIRLDHQNNTRRLMQQQQQQQNGRRPARYHMMSLLGSNNNLNGRQTGTHEILDTTMSFGNSSSAGTGGNINVDNHGGEHLRSQQTAPPNWFFQPLSLKLT